MKRKLLVLVAFLLVLFIAPMSFANVSAADYNFSDESITSFGETLPDNVMFYPDTLEEELFANAGSANGTAGYVVVDPYNRTFVLDAFAYSCSDGSGPSATSIYLNFSGPSEEHIVEYLDLSFYADISTGNGNISIWNHILESWILGVVIPEPFGAYSWCNFRVTSSDYWTDGFVWVRFLTDHSTNTNVRVDYGDITFGYMTNPFMLETDNFPYLGGTYLNEIGDEQGYPCYMNNTSDAPDDYDGIILNGDDLNGIGTGGGVIPNTAGAIRFSLNVTISAYSEGGGSDMYLSLIASSEVGFTGELNYFAQEDINGNGEIIIDGESNLSTIGSIAVGTNFTGLSTGDSVNITCNSYYFYIAGAYQTYTESFADVSDWTYTGDNMSSDGDRVTHGYDGTWKRLNTDNISLASMEGLYVEYRLKCSVALGTGSARLFGYVEDASQGGYAFYDAVAWSDEWTTHRYLLSSLTVYNDGPLESLRFSANIPSGETVEIDYLYIGPVNKMGWEHDGSSTMSTDGGASDGNSLMVTSSLTFDTDATTTSALIDTSYYPFLDLYVENGEGYILVEVSENGSSWSTVVSNTLISPSTHYRRNIFSIGIDIKHIRVNVSLWATVDYCQLYSIANYTYSEGASNTVNDYFYVNSGKLVVVNDIISVMRLNHDPTLSVTIATYDFWIASLTTGDENFRFRELLDTNTLWDTGITNGSLVGTTLIDFDILFYGDCELSAIMFSGIVDWNVITSVDLWFNVFGWHIITSVVLGFLIAFVTWSFDIFLLFLGLAMIPLSTIYLVKGGRSDMSMDKVFFGTVVFIFGWALFLGGIFG